MNAGGLRLDRPYRFGEIARHVGMDVKKLRRWLLRAAEAQPEVQGIVKVPGAGYIVPSVAKLREYAGWDELGKRFLSSEDNEALQGKIRDQDRQIQGLRARVAAGERVSKALEQKVEWMLKLLRRASGEKFPEGSASAAE